MSHTIDKPLFVKGFSIYNLGKILSYRIYVIRILHIYLDERDLRDKVWHDLRPNGFTEPRLFNDYPQREHKVLLHVRRRRWLDKDSRNVVLESLPLVADGTCYSVEFADFLKKMVGHLPCNGPMRGALLPD